MRAIADILLPLFILNLGVALGAGMYEIKIVVPLWFPKSIKAGYEVNTEVMNQLDSGRRFWAFVTTGPLTLLTLANLVVAWQSQHSNHGWWLTATLIALLERVSTFTFFIPTAIKLQKIDQLASAKISRLVTLWIGCNYIRNALTLLALISALLAFKSIA